MSTSYDFILNTLLQPVMDNTHHIGGDDTMDFDIVRKMYYVSQINLPTFDELMIGLSEVLLSFHINIMPMLMIFGNALQYHFGTLTRFWHDRRMAYCADMPAFPSAEWEVYAVEHALPAILCSDKVTRVADFIETARMAVPAIYWAGVSAVETVLDPEADEVKLGDHIAELFQFQF